jgi:3-hydroxyacyl-[acyl-carrier-protein] dehydratase
VIPSAGDDPISLGLPHRPPFLFVDKVVELVPGERAVAEKTFAPDDPIFAGHFPGNPIVPGVILTEALAQTAGLATGAGGVMLYLAAIKGMKFPGHSLPGETIALEAAKSGAAGGLIQCDVIARVGDRVVAQGTLVLGASRATEG